MSKKIIIDAFDKVACPHCGTDFVLQDAIAHQLIERYESEYAAMLDGERRQLRESLIADAERAAARRFNEQIERLQEQLAQSAAAEVRMKAKLEGAAKQAAEAVRREADRINAVMLLATGWT